ncbi:MAG: haloacid dehalogenase-like hydrolase [Polyangiaceae bacterium]|nr:haloacid dehalogenase-like hydrolase [Polyangiaceae bacterium]
MTPERLDVEQLLARLRAVARSGDVLAFDGDGTLWAGDVAEDALAAAFTEGLLRERAAPALEAECLAHALPSGGGARELAARLCEAHVAGRVDERRAYEIMAWCWAGWAPEELVREAGRILAARDLARRYHPGLQRVLAWARGAGLRCMVVSASPAPVVQAAAAGLGFAAGDIVAAEIAVEGGLLQPHLARPLTYAEGKVAAALAALGGARWLAAFGDSPFDLAMMREASMGVAVRPKASLLDALQPTDRVVVLAGDE